MRVCLSESDFQFKFYIVAFSVVVPCSLVARCYNVSVETTLQMRYRTFLRCPATRLHCHYPEDSHGNLKLCVCV